MKKPLIILVLLFGFSNLSFAFNPPKSLFGISLFNLAPQEWDSLYIYKKFIEDREYYFLPDEHYDELIRNSRFDSYTLVTSYKELKDCISTVDNKKYKSTTGKCAPDDISVSTEPDLDKKEIVGISASKNYFYKKEDKENFDKFKNDYINEKDEFKKTIFDYYDISEKFISIRHSLLKANSNGEIHYLDVDFIEYIDEDISYESINLIIQCHFARVPKQPSSSYVLNSMLTFSLATSKYRNDILNDFGYYEVESLNLDLLLTDLTGF